MTEGGTSTRAERGTRPRLLAANKAAAEFYAGPADDAEAADGADLPGRAWLRPGRRRALRLRVRPGRLGQTGQSADRAGVLAGRAVPGRACPAGPARARSTSSTAGCCGRSGTPPVTWSGSARAGCSTTTGWRPSTSTPRRPRCTRSRRCCSASTWPNGTSSRQRRAVVVEGYTDVMAMHLAGVTTAVASCGTAFGDEHISVLRRYLLDSDGDPRRGRLHLRRRLGGAEGRAQGVRLRPAVRRQHLRRGRPGRDGPVRAAAGQG